MRCMRTLINNGKDSESSERGACNCMRFADNFRRRIGRKKMCMASRGSNERRLTTRNGPITTESRAYQEYTSYWTTETFIKTWIATENANFEHKVDGLQRKIERALFRKSHLTPLDASLLPTLAVHETCPSCLLPCVVWKETRQNSG